MNTTAPDYGDFLDVTAAILADINQVVSDTGQHWQAARARRTRMVARMHAAIDRAADAARTDDEIAHDGVDGRNRDRPFALDEDVHIPTLSAFVNELLADTRDDSATPAGGDR